MSIRVDRPILQPPQFLGEDSDTVVLRKKKVRIVTETSVEET